MATPEEILEAISACFCAQLDEEVLCCVTAGDPILINCCPGQAWVRILDINPDGPTSSYAPCGPVMWIMRFELGVYRCAPENCGPLDPTCCNTEAEIAAQLIADRAAMLRAVSCCDGMREFRRSVTYGTFQIDGPEGGCISATQIVSVRFVDGCGCE